MNAVPNVGVPNVSTLSPVSLTNIEVGKYYIIQYSGFWQIVKVTGIDRASNGSSTSTGMIRVLYISAYDESSNYWDPIHDAEGAFPKSRIGESIKFYKKQEGGRRRKGTRRGRRVIARHRTRRHRRST